MSVKWARIIYYLTSGGKVSGKASTSMKPDISPTDEERITQYVSSWPTNLDRKTGTSSTPVGEGSSWTINETTGEVTKFSLVLGNKTYTSEDYGLRWAKFSYADTSSFKMQYHVDAILYEKTTVEKVIDTLNLSKQVTDYALDSNGGEQTSASFTFNIVDVNAQGDVLGKVLIPLTVTANGKDAVKLDAGTYAHTELAPGYYKVVEVQNENDLKAWNAANEVYFTVYTNGTVKLTENKETTPTITNSAKKYSVTYELMGGTGTIDAASGLKYNQTYKISETVPTKSGNVFRGWSESSTGDAVYQPGQEITIDGSKTLYAVWSPATVTKEVVMSNTTVDNVVNKNDYATVVTDDNDNCVAYTLDGTASILYKVTVVGYPGATVKITDTPTNGTVTYVDAVGATTTDGNTVTLSAASATLYYAVEVTDVTDDTPKTVGNSIDWSLGEVDGTTAAKDVTVYKTTQTLNIEKSITQVKRGEEVLDVVTDDTVLFVGDEVTYQVVVTNASSAPLTDVVVRDVTSAKGMMPGTVSLQINDGAVTTLTSSWGTLSNGNQAVNWTIPSLGYDLEEDKGDTAIITYSYTVVGDDRSPEGEKSLTNSAAALAGMTQGNSRSTHNFVEVPALDVTKTGTPNVSETGIMQISYTVNVTNTGNAALSQMVLNDAKFQGTVEVKKGDTAVSASLNGTELTVSDSLAVGETMTVTYNYEVTEEAEANGTLTVTNTVDVTGTTAAGATATKSATAETEVYAGNVELELAPIVIYTGGDGSNQAVVGDDGEMVDANEAGLPTFGMTMTLPDGSPVKVTGAGVAAELYDVTSDDGERANFKWSAVAYNGNATVLMQLTPEKGTDAARIKLIDDKGNAVTSDEFSVEDTLCQTYDTELYVWEEEGTQIIAEVDGKYYNIHYENSTLTIRGTTPDAKTNTVANDASQLKPDVDVPQAVVPSDASYYYVSGNGDNSGVLKVEDTSSVSLLVDEIVDQSVETDQQYVQMMKDKVEADGGVLGKVPADTTRTWRFFYMDLVLANNGNAVLTTDKDVTIYWPYPNGVTYQDVVDGKYDVKVLHYTGLNRNYASDAFATELNDCRMAVYTVTPTEQGLCFTVPSSDGFSPYALVYQTSTKTPEEKPGTDEGNGGSSDNSNSNNNQTTTTSNTTESKATAPAATPAPTAASIIPQTGDSLPLGLLFAVAGLAVAAMVALTVVYRRRRDK